MQSANTIRESTFFAQVFCFMEKNFLFLIFVFFTGFWCSVCERKVQTGFAQVFWKVRNVQMGSRGCLWY